MSYRRVAQALSNMLDKLSHLPNDVIYNILSRLPLMDAVRTSILSSKWRHHWTNLERLNIDMNFFDDYIGYGDKILSASTYERIVGSIMASHNGSILEFYLHVPDFDDDPNPSSIDMWIKSVSQCRVQDLTLEFDTNNEDHYIPSSLFCCFELERLTLTNIDLEHPLRFRSLSSLVILHLNICFATGDMLRNVVLNCPMLEIFSLDYGEIDTENGPFILSSPNLRILSIEYDGYFHIIFQDLPKVSTISVCRTGAIWNRTEVTNVYKDIVDFFGAIPSVENIKLNGIFCLEWVDHEVPESVSALLENHKTLVVSDLIMNSSVQLGSMCFLIKSSPNLQTLDISMDVSSADDSSQDIKDYLQSQLGEAKNLRSLKIVKLRHLMGHEHEISFIEIILSSCPMLVELHIRSHHQIASEVEDRMMNSILKLHRVSAEAKVMYSKLKFREGFVC